MFNKKLLSVAITAAALGSTSAFATNGMNLEGYGAKAHAMGGAGMAYDTGNSGVMNNPATLAFMKEGESRLGLGIRELRPDVEAKMGTYNAPSDGTSYFMPSISYMKKQNDLSYGVAVLAQGGMGTEYSNSFMTMDPSQQTMNMVVDTARSEVGVGRLMFPVAKQINDNLQLGASLDVVWASMDMIMAANTSQVDVMLGGDGTGTAAANFGMVNPNSYATFDFSNDDDFTGEAKGYGLGAKIGFTYKSNDKLTIGGAYHSKTNISDLETGDNSAAMTLYNVTMPDGNGGFQTVAEYPVTGKITVKDFQWPATTALGMSYKATNKWLLAADVKHIAWSDVMESFNMSFTSAMGTTDFSMTQNWDDQTVINLGAQYKYSENLALRFGVNHASNPVPDSTLNPLFPATVETHYTAGAGYKIDAQNKVGFAVAYAPASEATSAQGIETSHGQTNWSFNYVHNF